MPKSTLPRPARPERPPAPAEAGATPAASRRTTRSAPVDPAAAPAAAGAAPGKPPPGQPTRRTAASPVAPDTAPPRAVTRKARRTQRMPATDVRPFLEALARANPDAQTELAFETPFTLLVAVVLSAQATDASVNRATPALFAAAPTPAAMATLGADGIGPFVRSIGLWQGKARNLAALCRILVDSHAGQVPQDRASLEALPGVGRKTANVVLNVAFGQHTMAVDTHIFRLGNRTGLAPGTNVRVVEDALVKRVPRDMLRPAHHWLILHGRYVCKARTPECWRCVAAAWCRFPDKTPAPRVKAVRKSG